MSNGVLVGLQTALADRLTADSFFADNNIPVVIEVTKDIANTIKIAISKLGVCAVVITPNANIAYDDVPYPYFNKIQMVVRIFEQVQINATTGLGIPALTVAEQVAVIGHHFTPELESGGGPDVSTTFALDGPAIQIVRDPAYRVYDVRFKVACGIQASFEQLPAITGSFTDGYVYLYNTEPGAAIFYTTNGSLPSPTNPNATLYTTPFIATGVTITAKAWLAGYLSSDTFTLVVPSYSGPVVVPPPMIVTNQQLAPIVDDSGNAIVWPFVDQFTGDIVGLNVVDGAVNLTGLGGIDPLPITAEDGQLFPTVDDSGNVLAWPIQDQVTGHIVYLRVKDGQITVSSS